MTTYTCHLIGEDHTYFTVEVDASSKRDASSELEHLYPEATIDAIYSPDDIREMENARYRQIAAAQDSDWYWGDDLDRY